MMFSLENVRFEHVKVFFFFVFKEHNSFPGAAGLIFSFAVS